MVPVYPEGRGLGCVATQPLTDEASRGGRQPAFQGLPKSRKVEVVCTAYKATCIRQSLGKSVSSEWKAAINADIERIGTIVWLGSRAFLHYLTTSVATGKTTLPCDDNGLNRLIKACFTVHCDGTVEVASLPDSGVRRMASRVGDSSRTSPTKGGPRLDQRVREPVAV